MFCFNQPYHTNNFAYTYLALLIFCERSLSEEKKTSFLFKSGFCYYLGIAFTTFGNFLVITNWHRYRGRKCISSLGRMTRIAKFHERDFYEKAGVFTFARRLYICPGNFTFILNSITWEILGFRRVHTRANTYTKTLQTVENPEIILRNRNK